MSAPRIIALGDGGFSGESDNTLLDDYILGLPGKQRPPRGILSPESARRTSR